MSSDDVQQMAELKVDTANLYREEMFTDLRVATLRRLVPVRVDGSDDPSRPVLYSAQTTLMTQAGPVPVSAAIDARTLAEAAQKASGQPAEIVVRANGTEIARQKIDEVAVRGQYGRGMVEGKEASAYRDEPGVAPGSRTETYAALKLFIDNWRWEGVPFFIRSAKRLAQRMTEVVIQFKRPPLLLFRNLGTERVRPNSLVLRIQPDEGISLGFEVKAPGPEVGLRSLSLDFDYGKAFGESPPDAYEALLLDSMEGDASLFTRHDEVELAWSIVDPILDAWRAGPSPQFPNYKAGTWGPREADAFLAAEGRYWRDPD